MRGHSADQLSIAVLWNNQTSVMRGIVMTCLSTVAFSVMHAGVRYVSQELPPFQIAFFRNLFGLLFLVPLLVQSRFEMFRTSRLGLHAVRSVINIGAMLMFFTALSITPLAKVTAVSFTAPIFLAVLSVVFLGERFRIYRWLAILTGFLGMLIILRPGVIAMDTGVLLVAASAALWAVAMLLIKILSRTESSVTIVGWLGVFMCVFSLGPALWVWQPLTLENLIWMAFIGLCGSAAQIALSQSFRETDPTVVMPFDFLKLIWTALIGAWFFAEIPDSFTWIGAGLIFCSGLFIAYR